MINKEVIKILTDGSLTFYCPACNDVHGIKVNGPNAWQWNNSVYSPTFSPSILATSGHFTEGHVRTEECWCTYKENHPEDNLPFSCYRCHSIVVEGHIQYLADCSHRYASQTLPLPPHRDIDDGD